MRRESPLPGRLARWCPRCDLLSDRPITAAHFFDCLFFTDDPRGDARADALRARVAAAREDADG